METHDDLLRELWTTRHHYWYAPGGRCEVETNRYYTARKAALCAVGQALTLLVINVCDDYCTRCGTYPTDKKAIPWAEAKELLARQIVEDSARL